jgi:hypothetical protein
MICQKAMPAVSGLEKDFPGRVKAGNIDAKTEEGKQAVAALGFKSHGLVVRDKDGKAVFTQPDHTVDVDAARKAIADLLAKLPPAKPAPK